LVSRSFPYSEPHQSEKGDNYCLVFIIEQLKRMSITFCFLWNQGDDLEIHFWRCVNRTHVWYEWCVTKPLASAIHNPLGRSHNIGL
jgi:hypothetical protein